MEVNGKVVKQLKEMKAALPPRGKAKVNKSQRYPTDFKKKVVKLFLEEKYPAKFLEKELGVTSHSVYAWSRAYKKCGDTGLEKAVRGAKRPGKPKLPQCVKTRIVALKEENPLFGVKRISHVLRRMFFLPGSAETVRKTLHETGLMKKLRKKTPRNPARPRFFERATPNQMWQTDIFTFRLGGYNAYLIGFIDDHSRYIVGLGLFRGQTAENLLEVYRTAAGAYQPPKEMLTDNGRQYTAWHGTTKFEAELAKDQVKHIKSSPHHPMTLGKIERFWKTIHQEFLKRAQFEDFDTARARIALWVKYYNFKRPHQSLEGMCPADRYFAIQEELKKTIAAGIKENLLELALRGEPKKPFYMVGRMGDQSVALRAEKGKLSMVVEDKSVESVKEITYDIQSGGNHGNSENSSENKENETGCALGEGAVRSGTLGVDGAEEGRRSLPGDGNRVDDLQQLAESGDRRDVTGAGAEEKTGEGAETVEPPCEIASGSDTDRRSQHNEAESGESAEADSGGEKGVAAEGERSVDGFRGQSPEMGGSGIQSPLRPDDGDPRSGSVECFPEDVLRTGESGPLGGHDSACGSATGETGESGGSGENETPGENQGTGAEVGALRAERDLAGTVSDHR